MNVIAEITKTKKDQLPDFNSGDTIKIYYKIQEAGKERIQIFEGVVIAFSGKGISKTMTVRRISYDIGVERIFPIYSPKIDKIEIMRKGFVRRAKLYYLRTKTGKKAKIREAKHFFLAKDSEKKESEVQETPETSTPVNETPETAKATE